MPANRLVFYKEEAGVAVLDWLASLRRRNPRAYAKCRARINRLAEEGHAWRRPEADFLRDGVFELRARLGSINYRVLYGFHGRDVAILAHALTKEDRVPPAEIDRAAQRLAKYRLDPTKHTYSEPIA